uniref:Uncharacterized protein n=1 Tax=Candidatus Methanogaster sp. ANME-2c ERB4 TaxID=2759911 RepID=A0A7G9Y4Z7_9EURY|nr:hypothetical protein DICHBKDE_00023 [Methanosarcinales archaeon ANME-2c ERB4]
MREPRPSNPCHAPDGHGTSRWFRCESRLPYKRRLWSYRMERSVRAAHRRRCRLHRCCRCMGPTPSLRHHLPALASPAGCFRCAQRPRRSCHRRVPIRKRSPYCRHRRDRIRQASGTRLRPGAGAIPARSSLRCCRLRRSHDRVRSQSQLRRHCPRQQLRLRAMSARHCQHCPDPRSDRARTSRATKGRRSRHRAQRLRKPKQQSPYRRQNPDQPPLAKSTSRSRTTNCSSRIAAT